MSGIFLRKQNNLQVTPIISKLNMHTIFNNFINSNSNLDELGSLLVKVKKEIDDTVRELATLVIDRNQTVRALDAYCFLKPSVGFSVWLSRGFATKTIRKAFEQDIRSFTNNYDMNLHFLLTEEVKKRAYIKFYKSVVKDFAKKNNNAEYPTSSSVVFDFIFGIKTSSISVRLAGFKNLNKKSSLVEQNQSEQLGSLSSFLNNQSNNVGFTNQINPLPLINTLVNPLTNTTPNVISNSPVVNKNNHIMVEDKVLTLLNLKFDLLNNRIDDLEKSVSKIPQSIQAIQNSINNSTTNVVNEIKVVNENKTIKNVSVVLNADEAKVQEAYFTVEQFALFLGFNDRIDLEVKKQAGIAASKICRTNNINRIPTYGNEQFTVVNSYPFYVVKQAYESLGYNFV